LTNAEIENFDLSTRHGQAAIADRIKADLAVVSKHLFTDKRRGYMGCSVVGHECNRYLWNAFRWIKEEVFSGQMMRLFDTGHREEERFILYLRMIGFTVEEIDPNTNKQYRVYFASKHGSGSCDGLGAFPTRYGLKLDGINLLFEFKTANAKSFAKVFNTGYRDAKPVHWSQTCQYGYKFQATHCVYMMKNKDTDEIEVDIEELNWEFGKRELEKAEGLIVLPTPPPTIRDSSMAFPCSYCWYKQNCYSNLKPEKNCRSCVNAVPIQDGQWQCNLYSRVIPEDFIPKGCDSWQSIL
jgi:hypothetical protein